MTERETNIQNMFISTVQFHSANSADYADIPDAVTHFAIVQAVIAELVTYAAAQISGARGRAVEQKTVIREAIRRKMYRYSHTARGLNIDDAGFRRLFSVPDDNNDQLLLATAREFVVQARLFKTNFLSRGIPVSLADDLEDDIEAMEAAIIAKAGAHTEKVGAGAGIDEQIEKGMKSEKILDSVMHNVYFDDPVKLAEWMSARHVKKSSKPKPKPKSEPKPE